MSKSDDEKAPQTDLNLYKVGSWEAIVDFCEDIGTLLECDKIKDISSDFTEDKLEGISEDWEEWRPRDSEDFSEEMREKTAEHSSIGKSKLEEEGKEPSEEMKNATDSISKATEKVDEDLDETKTHLSDAFKSAGKAVDSTVRQGIRKVEENVYENLILKTNSLYFDSTTLNAVISKRIGSDPSERYKLTLHSNNPQLRKFLVERIDLDEC